MPRLTYAPRSLLFVPGSRPERFDKAVASGADQICIDLEDAVPATEKDSARAHVTAYLDRRAAAAERGAEAVAILVRINALSSPEGLRDLLAFAEAPNLPDGILLAKVRHEHEPQWARRIIGKRCPTLLAMIENAEGLLGARVIAECAQGGMVFGPADYAADLGIAPSREALDYARSHLVAAARAAGVDAIDGPCLKIDDENGLIEETRHARTLGFAGKALLHPRQVAPVHAVYRPTPAELERARRILAAAAAAEGGPVVVDGEFIDAPVAARFSRMLAWEAQEDPRPAS